MMAGMTTTRRPTTKPLRAAGYVRISRETDDTLSPITQRKRIKALCADRGWTLVAMHEDIDESSFEARRRPALETMLGRLDEVDAIVFAKIDRFSRTTAEGVDLAQRCRDADVQLVSCEQGEIDTASAEGEFQYTLFLSLGRLEVKRLQERTKAGLATSRALGHYSGRVPYGWRRIDKKLVPNRAEQAVLRRAAKRYVAGDTFSALAQDFDFAAPTVISRILGSPRVQASLGDLGVELTVAIRERKGERRATSQTSLLGGIARCAECGGGLRRSSTRAGRQGRWYAYRCEMAGHAGIAGPWLEDHVSAAVLGAIDLDELSKRMRRRDHRPQAVEAARISERLEAVEDMLADGVLSRPQYVRQHARLTGKLAEARAADADDDVPPLSLDLARHLPERWPDLTTAERRSIVKALVRAIRVERAVGHGPIDPNRVEIVWR